MARPVDHARRQQLLDDAVDYVIANGIADLSLRPLAEALGTQAPVLLHHFGSKEQLLVVILNGVRDRLRSIAREARATDTWGAVDAVWAWSSAPERDPFFRVFFEGYALALRRPDLYATFLDTVVQDWLDDFPSGIDDAAATLAVAVVRGLLLDLLATGDRARCDAAMAQATTMLRAHTTR